MFSDRDGRVFGFKPSQPQESWSDVVSGVMAATKNLAGSINVKEYMKHKRGPFASVSMGMSYGGGQKVGVIRFISRSCWLSNRPPPAPHVSSP